MISSSNIRVRFAPSPTGYVHIGSLRTALYNYLFAKKQGGEYLLRLEDTDKKRFVSGATENLLSVLETMGLLHSEGPFISQQLTVNSLPESPRETLRAGQQQTIESVKYPGIVEVGDYGPYIQSERLELYRKYAQELIDSKKAYYCFCSPERLDAMRKEQMTNKQMPKYDRLCCQLSSEEIQKNLDAKLPDTTIRFKLPDNETVWFTDMVRGEVSFNTASMADAVLLKSDGYPTYHLAMAVDDHFMRISHVIRSEEWLPSLPLHVLLYRAFGWDAPQFAHLPLIINADKSKLSKRQGDVAVEDYLKKGYLKEALINFVAMLGWNPGEGSMQELFSMDELIEKFDFEHVHKAGAVFDMKKLDWINAQYIKRLSVDELYEKSLPFWQEKDFYKAAKPEQQSEEYLKKVLFIERDRLNRLDAVGESNAFFFIDTLEYDKELLRWKKNTDDEIITALTKAQEVLTALDEQDWTQDNLSEKLMAAAGEKRGDLLWPLRVALTGAKQSPSPFEVAFVLGKIESLKRIGKALSK
ncbi:MAG: glutamate--tRNA ligase [Candidatus Moranbacteria bacterium]|nr:glutamate--tRNA ligase [Candidatus Moranbacteria bacterium]